MLVYFSPRIIYFSAIFYFHFRDEFQGSVSSQLGSRAAHALISWLISFGELLDFNAKSTCAVASERSSSIGLTT